MTFAHRGYCTGERYWQCTERIISDAKHSKRRQQCLEQATYDHDSNGNPTKCGLHSAEAKRIQRQQEKYEAQMAKVIRQGVDRDLALEAQQIVRKIADGHHDPMGLCLDWVNRKNQNNTKP